MKELAEQLADDEIAHVKLLRDALSTAAEKCPKMDIGDAFAAAAEAAFTQTGSGLSTPDPAFSPYKDDLTFAHAAFLLEDVGVTAYAGAAGAASHLLPSSTHFLATRHWTFSSC